VTVISLFAEVEAGSIQIVVRDRGKGFDPSSVRPDRKGVAESINGRMTRFGGTAVISSEIGEGTKVTLTMPQS
jgi:signal transduction histidine kinase